LVSRWRQIPQLLLLLLLLMMLQRPPAANDEVWRTADLVDWVPQQLQARTRPPDDRKVADAR